MTTVIGTFFYSGFMPLAPATFASLLFALVYVGVPRGELLANPIVALVTLIVSVPAATRLERRYGHDAKCIVIDEIVGMQILLVWSSPTVVGVIVGFLLFRFFDIVKPFPIRLSQALPDGYGVVCDDVLAGAYARITMMLVALLFPAVGRFV